MTKRTGDPSLKLAVVLMTGSSFLVPAVGLVTAPLLARALSPEGRGDLAAALGPATLMLAVATLGLPEALTYQLARRPRATTRALTYASLVTLGLGAATGALTWALLPFLSGGRPGLASMMFLATLVTVPALVVNVFRGAASGHQLWGRVALERVIVTLWRLLWFVGLFVTHHLTVFTAILVIVTAPFASIPVYAPFLRPRRRGRLPTATASSLEHPDDLDPVFRPLVAFGARLWFGSVASMFLARISALFMVPLSSARDLGLYSVAVMVADVPLLVAFAIQSAVFGVNSKTQDAGQTTTTSRLTLFVGLAGSLSMAAVLPFAIVPLFGREFSDALLPCLLLLANAVISIPGLMAASGLAAWGRPGMRSIGLALTLVVNVTAFVLLVPRFGVMGACLAGLASGLVMSAFMTRFAGRTMHVSAGAFWLVRPADLRSLGSEIARQLGRVRSRVRVSGG